MSLTQQSDLVIGRIKHFLTKEDCFVLRHVKGFHTWSSEIKDPKDICEHYAAGGHLNVLKWLREYYDQSFRDMASNSSRHTCSYAAAAGGHLEVLRWLKDEYLHKEEFISLGAGRGGHTHIIQWGLDNRCMKPSYMLLEAAKWGHMAVLETFIGDLGSTNVNDQICTEAAKHGHLDIIKWARSRGFDWGPNIWSSAASRGQMELLEWMKEEGVPGRSDNMCDSAAKRGQIEALKWAKANGTFSTQICYYAATRGHVHVLEWAAGEEGARWNRDELRHAAVLGGHVTVFGWLAANGTSLCENDVRDMLSMGYLHAVEWAEKNNHVSGATVCSIAARLGKRRLLKWARDKGFAWDSKTCSSAAKRGELKLLIWAVDNGCPYDGGVCRSAARGDSADILEWASQRGIPYDINDLYELAIARDNYKVLAWLTSKLLKRTATEVADAQVAWKKKKIASKPCVPH